MAAALLIVYLSPLINRIFKPTKQTRPLTIVILKKDLHQKETILSTIAKQGIRIEEKKLEAKEDKLIVTVETVVELKKKKWLEEYLVSNPTIESFSF